MKDAKAILRFIKSDPTELQIRVFCSVRDIDRHTFKNLFRLWIDFDTSRNYDSLAELLNLVLDCNNVTGDDLSNVFYKRRYDRSTAQHITPREAITYTRFLLHNYNKHNRRGVYYIKQARLYIATYLHKIISAQITIDSLKGTPY